jgi:hypothetical protein
VIGDEALFPPQSRNVVSDRCGQALSPTLWQGRQWSVTTYGIECRDGKYAIDAKNFVSKPLNAKHTWSMHMREKNWVDMEDFNNAVIAFRLLFDLKGNRNLRDAPRLMDESEIEYYAAECAEEAYKKAKFEALHGRAAAVKVRQ